MGDVVVADGAVMMGGVKDLLREHREITGMTPRQQLADTMLGVFAIVVGLVNIVALLVMVGGK